MKQVITKIQNLLQINTKKKNKYRDFKRENEIKRSLFIRKKGFSILLLNRVERSFFNSCITNGVDASK